MNMRRNGLGLLASLAFTCLAASAACAKTVLRVGDSYPAGHPVSETSIKAWIKAVEAKVGDEVGFEYYPAQQIGKAKDLLSLVSSGAIDVALIDAGYNPDKLPLSEVSHLPGTFERACSGTMAYWKMITEGTPAKREWQRQGLHPILGYAFNPFQVFLTKPFHTLAELKGMKLRSAGPAVDETIRALNAVPIRMTTAETYQSLSRGTIDGGMFSVATARAYGFDSLSKASTLGANFGGTTVGYAMNQARWAGLSPKVQAAMSEASIATMRQACKTAESADEASIAKMRAAGMALITLSPEDQAAMQKIAAKAQADWAADEDRRGRPGTQVLREFIGDVRQQAAN